MFLCTSCGYSADADLNASKNILMRFLEHDSIVRVQKAKNMAKYRK